MKCQNHWIPPKLYPDIRYGQLKVFERYFCPSIVCYLITTVPMIQMLMIHCFYKNTNQYNCDVKAGFQIEKILVVLLVILVANENASIWAVTWKLIWACWTIEIFTPEKWYNGEIFRRRWNMDFRKLYFFLSHRLWLIISVMTHFVPRLECG